MTAHQFETVLRGALQQDYRDTPMPDKDRFFVQIQKRINLGNFPVYEAQAYAGFEKGVE